MTQENRDGFYVAGRYFACVEEFEEYCFNNPEFEGEVDEQMYLNRVREDVDTYYLAAYLECCDKNTEMSECVLCECALQY